MDDKREGRPSFKTSDVVKNEVCDVIDGVRRLSSIKLPLPSENLSNTTPFELVHITLTL